MLTISLDSSRMYCPVLIQGALTSYKIDYSGISEESEDPRKLLKTMVEVTGFEPVTPCLQSRCSAN